MKDLLSQFDRERGVGREREGKMNRVGDNYTQCEVYN